MGKRNSKKEKFNVGVYVAADVLEYLNGLEMTYGCNRSFLINAIVREHAQGLGGKAGAKSPSLSRVIQM